MSDEPVRPAALVPVAVAAWEQAWSESLQRVTTLGKLLFAIAEDQATAALADAPPRPASEALRAAWEAVHPVMGRLMANHGYLADTVDRLRHVAASTLKATADDAETAPDSSPHL